MCIQSEKLYKQKVFSLLINQVSKVSVLSPPTCQPVKQCWLARLGKHAIFTGSASASTPHDCSAKLRHVFYDGPGVHYVTVLFT